MISGIYGYHLLRRVIMNASAHKQSISQARRVGIRGSTIPKPVYGGRRCYCGGFQDTRKGKGRVIQGTRLVIDNPCSNPKCTAKFTVFWK